MVKRIIDALKGAPKSSKKAISGQSLLANMLNVKKTTASVVIDKDPAAVYSGLAPWVSACVDALTRDIVSQEYFFTSQAGKEIPYSRVNEAVITPFVNRWHGVGFYDVLRLVVPNLLLTGNAFIWKVKGTAFGMSKGFPDMFIPIPTQHAKIDVAQSGEGVERYQFQIGNNTYYAPPSEVIHFKQNAIYSPFVGVGNITKLRLLVEGEIAAAEYLNTFMSEAKGAPTTTIIDKTSRTPDDYQRVADLLKKMWSPKILYFPVDDATITHNSILSKDFNFLEQRKFDVDAVIAIFGVPRIVLGIPDDSNRATSTNQFPYYYRLAVNPRILELTDAINAQHVALVDKNLTFNLRKHASGDVKETIDMLNNGIITPNQAAKRLGEAIDTIKEGRDDYYLPSNLVAMGNEPAEPVAAAPLPDASSQDDNVRKLLSDPRNVDAIVEAFHKSAPRHKSFQGRYLHAGLKTRATLEDKFVASISAYFKRQEKDILNILSGTKKDLQETLEASEGVYIYLGEESKTEGEMLRPLHTSGVQRAIGDINAITGAAINPATSNPFVKGVIDTLGQRITGVLTETTLKDLRKIFKAALDEGMAINEIQDRIAGKFSQYQTTRARMIARTEVRAAWDAGAYVSYTDLGVKKFDVIGCTMFESNSDCGKRNLDIHYMPSLKFHPNHIGVICPSEEL